jgi:hypothetical protein
VLVELGYLEGVQLVGEALVELGGESAVLLNERFQEVLFLTIRDVKDYREGVRWKRVPMGARWLTSGMCSMKKGLY